MRRTEVVLDEVVGVDPRIGQVAVAECAVAFAQQQRRRVCGVDAADVEHVGGRREDRHQAVAEAVVLEVVQQPEVLHDIGLRGVDGAFPVEIGQQVENDQLVFLQRRFAQVHVHRIDHQRAVLLAHDARSDGVLLVHRNGDALRGDVVGLGAVGEQAFAARVLAADEVHHLADGHRTVDGIDDGNEVVGVGVFAAGKRQRHRCRLVGPGLHLVDVPLAAQVGGVHHPHVGAHAVHLLVEPQGERVVVAVVQDDRIRECRLEVVPAYVAGVGAVRTVVVVPVLRRKDRRHAEAEERGSTGRRDSVAAQQPGERIAYRHHAQSDPDGEGVERSGVDVVAFAGFVGRGVEVEHQGDAREHEQQHDDREVALVAHQLVHKADQSQDERQEVVGVAPLVVGDFVRQVALRAEVLLVDPADAREPVAVGDGRMGGLDVALASYEVPHEVAPVHVAELVVDEEVQVFEERRLDDGVGVVAVVEDALAPEVGHRALLGPPLRVAHDFALLVAYDFCLRAVGRPGFVVAFVVLVVPHAGKEVHELGCVFHARDDLCGRVLAVLAEIAHGLALVIDGRRGVVGAEEQRTVAVLVAVEQCEQRVRVVGVVAVHRRVGRRADRHRSVGREADEDHRDAEQRGVPHGLVAAVGVPRGPAQRADERQREEDDARIDGESERIDEQHVEHRADVYRVGNDQVVDEEQDGAGGEQRAGGAAQRDLLCGAEVVDEDECRDGQQVQDVHADREPHEVGDQHDPPCRAGRVGLLLPFEHEPHHQRREKRRQGVDLAFDGREPEGVGEGVGQCAHESRAEHRPYVGLRGLGAFAAAEAHAQVGDGPEKKEDAACAGQAVHGIDHVGHVVRRGGEERGDACQHHEQRRSGGVSHLKLVGGGDELGAVPQTRRRFHREQVDRCGDGEDAPAEDAVPAFEKIHGILFSLIEVVVHGLALVVLQVGERRGLHADVEAPAAVRAERNPRERHLPAVQVAGDVDACEREVPVAEAVTGADRNAGLGRDVEAAVELDALIDDALVAFGRIVAVLHRIVDVVTHAQVPRNGEVVVASGHVLPAQCGVHAPVGVDERVGIERVLGRDVVQGGCRAVFARLERIVERPARAGDAAREEEFVVAASVGRDAVGVERDPEFDAEVLDERAAEADSDVRESHRVGQEVVGTAERQFVDDLDLAHTRGVALAQDLHFEGLVQ